MNRRTLLQGAAGSAVALLSGSLRAEHWGESSGVHPNFLWISTEDINPDLRCYGDSYAITPNIDRFATQGVRYNNVFSHSGVCAPTRSGIITGMYPTTLGTQHMRCQGVPPAYVKCFSEYLRAAGYYCTNNAKTDYQFDPPLTAWDECGNKAHWRNRPKDRPFFAVFNIMTTHEGQIRSPNAAVKKGLSNLAPGERHDPAQVQLPPYYPDTPKVRQDWARYYDLITLMDKQMQGLLDQLAADGLAEDTIVWFWGDNGRGLPRGKRWLYDSGTRIPLIIRVPAKWRKVVAPDHPETFQPGTANDDLVAFIDFAPTLLSLAGIEIPGHIQGRAFLGGQKAPPREYVFGARDRMDEAYDLIRCVRDQRFKYIRNYMWYVSRGQDINYMNQMPTMREMRRLNAEGKLQGPQKQYFEPTKPVEELYDIVADPHEVNNLAGDAKYQDVLERLRKAHRRWYRETGDIGLVPEPLFDEMKRPGGAYEKTAEPVFVKGSQDGGAVALACATPGASIAWRIGGNVKSQTGWELYVQPVRLQPGETLHAKACRLGFRDSAVVTYKLGDPVQGPPAAAPTHPWREQIDATDLLERLAQVKESDYPGTDVPQTWLARLKDPEPAVRYWAVAGLQACATSGVTPPVSQTPLLDMLQDPSAVVRIAAARALCDRGEEKAALPVLVEALKNRTDKTRLFAVIALDQIGAKARPALSQIEALTQDRDEYVKRVATTILERWQGKVR